MAECIALGLDPTCGPAEYEWLYIEAEMHAPGRTDIGERPGDWIPLCVLCCELWRRTSAQQEGRPYRVRSIRAVVSP